MKINLGHLKSQKFAGFVFGTFVLFIAAFALEATVFSTLVMGVCGLYGAFCGARAWSDNVAVKFGQRKTEPTVTKRVPEAPEDDEEEEGS